VITDWTLVEACSGGASLSLWACGVRRRPVPYFGSKWSVRRELAGMLPSLGFVGAPSDVVLCDPGPWPIALKQLFNWRMRQEVVRLLGEINAMAPADALAHLQGGAVPRSDAQAAAEFLWLQRMSFSAKPVGWSGGVWRSPGLNLTSAIGLSATESFGAVRPMGLALVDTLQRDWNDVPPCLPITRCVDAADSIACAGAGALVYIDPPYQETTGYPDGDLDRAAVIELATACRDRGAAVMVSEAEPLPIPGFSHRRIATLALRSRTAKPREEWITYARAAH